MTLHLKGVHICVDNLGVLDYNLNPARIITWEMSCIFY